MSENAFDILNARGLLAQSTDEAAIRRLLAGDPIPFYIGFDATATSLHAGSLVPIMAMMHLQRAGHHPIALVGTGTTMIGDPTGKEETRKMLDEATIRGFGQAIHAQLDHFLGFSENKATPVDNADWLLELKYIEFLRDIGKRFSVNRMLSAETYRRRLEREEGLNFIELNYQILQAYDFLHLYRETGCLLQMGGDDQWSNILAGVDLVRRMERVEAEAMTFPLLTTADGKKMGKSERGAIWLDAELLAPYDFYQYWINCLDADVARNLRTFTFLPLDEIERLEALEGAELREAKRVLAREVTTIVHGPDAADAAESAAKAAFGGGAGGDLEAMPNTAIESAQLDAGLNLLTIVAEVGLTGSRGEAKRLMQQGGVYVNDARIQDLGYTLGPSDLSADGILLRAGKKKYHRLIVEG